MLCLHQFADVVVVQRFVNLSDPAFAIAPPVCCSVELGMWVMMVMVMVNIDGGDDGGD